MAAYHAHRTSKCMAVGDVRTAAIPASVGLITRIDNQIGMLMAYLVTSGRLDVTHVVYTSERGDDPGDRRLGEKVPFHNPSVPVPLIVVDPDPAVDATRGTVNSDLVEAIDLIPTLIDAAGARCRTTPSKGTPCLEFKLIVLNHLGGGALRDARLPRGVLDAAEVRGHGRAVRS
ncbi:sulfatase-like hydrolase/transferase [Thalassorhabdomicrobium marinisediminis]|uniref:sulfatase-like hydrolase/transferase n=1 Tax=Thalassorhabdomicrobium marinisediminis TaxID=2170577 RepID=UPI002491518F|nr:sulfatase-like hydrolase/transferase [Thalassorhabdomicrobium marinisediminis]